jgi:hypothetical protein
MAGIVTHKRIVEPNNFRKKRYLEIWLQQSEFPDESITIRFYNADLDNIFRYVKKNTVAVFIGSVRRKVIPNDDGTINHVRTYIKAKMGYTPTLAIHGIDLVGDSTWLDIYMNNLGLV